MNAQKEAKQKQLPFFVGLVTNSQNCNWLLIMWDPDNLEEELTSSFCSLSSFN